MTDSHEATAKLLWSKVLLRDRAIVRNGGSIDIEHGGQTFTFQQSSDGSIVAKTYCVLSSVVER